ncbi:hypothetical protein CAPTEDRAFT_227509 [Capitella teleta]|uniref:PHTF1/2 N-terminal domain-containing protein n=1 Tax=Capitella teleta TaxID=283909 RepID=R7URX4_CAPTE|nr:hypothetical protein CAPTEDRAFT_227509 [Capitella teleta]|eukprot:ELU06136.1 hypothetical protein CAPTEDRAFT_227509 [Capitella teleta]
MDRVNDAVSWYQEKISTYDKQLWEKSVEQKVLKSIQNVPRKTTKVHPGLIDLDLVRGSMFTKAKAQHSWFAVTRLGLIRVIFLPFYYKWWLKSTCRWITCLLLLLYASQFFTMIIYFTDGSNHLSAENLSLAHLLSPLVMMAISGLIHEHIVDTQLTGRSRRCNLSARPSESLNRKKPKGKYGQKRVPERDSGSHDTGIDTNAEDCTQGRCHCGDRKSRRKTKAASEDRVQESLLKQLQEDADDETEDDLSATNAVKTHRRSRSNRSLLSDKETVTYKNATDDENGVSGITAEAEMSEEATGELLLPQDSECVLSNDRPADHEESFGLRKRLNAPDSDVPPLRPSSRVKSLPETSSCDSEKEEPSVLQKVQSSGMEWDDTGATDITSCSDSSDSENSSSSHQDGCEEDTHNRKQNIHHVASIMNNLASSTAKVSCLIWEGDEVKKVDLTVLDVGWTIIKRVECIPEKADYIKMGVVLSFLLVLMPCAFRLYHSHEAFVALNWADTNDLAKIPGLLTGENWRQKVLVINGLLQRFCLSLVFFFLLSVVEKTFKQRLLYAKHFCYLTSSRRSKKYELPHFRLNKVRNIKIWLSLRSYLKKCGPQRSVDSIVSAAFMLAVLLVSIMCIQVFIHPYLDAVYIETSLLQLLHDYGRFLDHLGNWELVLWAMALSLYLLRFITLGTKINKKYRNFAVLITEQINLYLHMEQKPHKKEELMVANSVLKLAEDLLKELESPFKISGLSANPFLYNITKVIILSAFSAVLTEILGFKLKLYKIKLRA